jgi:hypothetical protein
MQRLTTRLGATQPGTWGLLAFAVSALVFLLADWFPSVMPTELAQIEGAVALPLLLVSAGLCAVGVDRADRPTWLPWLVNSIGAALGLGVIALFVMTTTQVDCRPVTGPLDVLPRAAVLGLIIGGGWLVAVRLQSFWVAIVVWPAALLVALLAFVLMFPPLSCAAPSA